MSAEPRANAEVKPLAEMGDLGVYPWRATGGFLLVRRGDDLNPDEGLLLSADEFCWLVTYPGPLIAGRVAEAKRRPIARRR